MKRVDRYVRVAVLSVTVIFSYVAIISLGPSTAGADATVTAFYLDIGGSASLGVQPVAGYPVGHRTDEGYADFLVAQEASKGVTLDLHEIGCSGETTNSMIHGGDHCYVSPNTQLTEAISFLQAHHDENGLVTIDLGFNDVLPCLHVAKRDQSCVDRKLNTVRQQLTEIVGLLKDVAGANVKFIGVGHYDPYLGYELNESSRAEMAKQSLPIVRRLDEAMSSVYGSFGIPTADVGKAFQFSSTVPVSIAGHGTVPENVAEVCLLTWMCQLPPLGPNIHPNDAGYETIADAIEQVLTPW